MTENYKQIEDCFISNRAFNTYSTLIYDEQLKVRPLFKSIANATPQNLPITPIPGIQGNFRWRLDKYSLILKIFMGRLVLEEIVLNTIIDQVYAK
jgi:hypothetical protein